MRIIFIMLLSVILFSCNQNTDRKEVIESPIEEAKTDIETSSEDFEHFETDEFNQIVAGHEKDLSAKEVMQLYYPFEVENSEGNEEININEKTLENGNTLVTLIHDNQMDDSVKGEKFIMELAKSEGQWNVLSIKKNWKCYEGRGHTDWGTAFCL